jgi:hypothetical protein
MLQSLKVRANILLLPWYAVMFNPYMLILTHLLSLIGGLLLFQGLIVYGRQGREIFRSNLDLSVCREVFHTEISYGNNWI